MEVVSLLLVFLAGLLSGIANTIAGGGSILTVPLLILLGLPPVVANGTNRVAILVQCLSAMIGFRQYNILHLRNISSYVIPSLVGAFIGAVIGVQIPDTLFKKIFALFMILALLFFFVKKEQGDKKRSAKKNFILPLLFFFIGIYGGIIQVGVGFVIILALTHYSDMDLQNINVIKTVVVFCYTVVTIATFAFAEKIDWSMAFILAIGSGLGGFFGSVIIVKVNPKIVKIFIFVIGVAFSFYLLFSP